MSMRLVQYVRMMPQFMVKDDVLSASNVIDRHSNWCDVLGSYPLNVRAQRLLSLNGYS